MLEDNRSYEIFILSKVIRSFLDKRIPLANKESLLFLIANQDAMVWEISTRIYSESGHKVRFSMVRDVIQSRIKEIEFYIISEEERIKAEEERINAELEIANRSRLIELTKKLREFGRDESMAQLFLKVQDVISKKISVYLDSVNLESSICNDLGADELALIMLVEAFEEEFNIEISDSEIESAGTTVWGFLNIINRKINPQN